MINMIICTHSYSQDPMLAFASPGSDARFRIPRVRCEGDHRLVPRPSLRGSQWQPRWGGASRDGRALSAGVQWDCGNQSRETRRL